MLPVRENEVTPEWLTAALRRSGALERGVVRSVRGEQIAQGVGLMARIARMHVEYEGADSAAPRSIVAKFPIDLAQNLGIAQFYRFYGRECAFYQELAASTPLRVPRCYGVEREGDHNFVLLLEDLGAARVGDQVAGNSAEDAMLALSELAAHHALFWDKAAALDFLVDNHDQAFCDVLDQSYRGSLPVAIEAYPNRFTPALREAAESLAGMTTALFRRNLQKPLTVIHGDFRADNLFYGLADGSKVAVIDWQISGRGVGPFDLGYHLTQSVSSEVRRQIERPAVEAYHATLQKHGITTFSLADLWEEYREAALFALVYPITVCGGLDLTNERARALGDAFLTRSLDAIQDLNAIEKLPSLRTRRSGRVCAAQGLCAGTDRRCARAMVRRSEANSGSRRSALAVDPGDLRIAPRAQRPKNRGLECRTAETPQPTDRARRRGGSISIFCRTGSCSRRACATSA